MMMNRVQLARAILTGDHAFQLNEEVNINNAERGKEGDFQPQLIFHMMDGEDVKLQRLSQDV